MIVWIIILTAPAKSDAETSIRKQESSLINEFISNARKAKPDGRIVVSENGNIVNILLEDGGVIVIPYKSDVVTISGEVLIPQAVVYAKDININDCIVRAGGFSARVDRGNILIRKANGQIITKGPITPGDELIILPNIDTKNFQFAKDILGIIFQLAVSGKAVGIV